MHTTHTVCGCGREFLIEVEDGMVQRVVPKMKEEALSSGSLKSAAGLLKNQLCSCGRPVNPRPCSKCLKPQCEECALVEWGHVNPFCICSEEKEYTSRKNDGFAQCEKKVDFPAIVFKGTGFTQSAESKKSDNQ